MHPSGLFLVRMEPSPAVLAGVVPGLTLVEGGQGGSDYGEEVLARVVPVEVVLGRAVGRYQGVWGSGEEVPILVAVVEVSRGLAAAGERSEEGVLAPVVLVQEVLGLAAVGERRVGWCCGEKVVALVARCAEAPEGVALRH